MLKAAGQTAAAVEADPRDQPEASRRARASRAKYAHFDDWANVLFDQALLAEGGQLDDPATFVKRVNQLMLEMGGGGEAAAHTGTAGTTKAGE